MNCPVCNENRVIKAKYCYNCGTKFVVMKDVKHSLFLHGTYDDFCKEGKDIGLSEDLLHNFSRSLYEVRFDGKINMSTGDFSVESIYIGDNVYRRYE